MKKQKRGANFEKIKQYLTKTGIAYASQIQKATGVKGNIYSTLQTMQNRGEVSKFGKMYKVSREPELKNTTVINVQEPAPNPYLNILKREHEHIMQGIQQLQISANYLNLRIKELERGATK